MMLAQQIVRQGGEIQSISNKTGLLTLYKSELPIIWFVYNTQYIYVMTIDKMLHLIPIDGGSHMLEIEIDDIPLSIVERALSKHTIFYEKWVQRLVEKDGKLVKEDKMAISELYKIDDSARVIEYSSSESSPRVATHNTTYSRMDYHSMYADLACPFDPDNPPVEYTDYAHIYRDGQVRINHLDPVDLNCQKYVTARGLQTLILDRNGVLTISGPIDGEDSEVIHTEVLDVALHYDTAYHVTILTPDSLKLYNTTGTTLLREFKGNFYLSSITKHSWERNYRSCSNHIKSSRS